MVLVKIVITKQKTIEVAKTATETTTKKITKKSGNK